MQRSSIILLTLIILSGVGIFFLPSSTSQDLSQTKSLFESFKHKFNKNYLPSQQGFRYKIFKLNLEIINKHNIDNTKTYKMGINKFTDLTNQEFVQKYLNLELKNMKKTLDIEEYKQTEEDKLKTPPVSVDWRGKNVITPVMDQGDCGSSWTFSATGTVESVLAVKNKSLIPLSKQQLLDCCTYAKYGCQGCRGAFPDWALSYANDFGMVLQSQYPFTTWKDTCKPIPTAKKYLDHRKPFILIANNTNVMKTALAENGPLSVSVDAYKWQYYVSGVYNDCHDDHVTLAVLLVGYQADGTWILRNSWGTTWGEQGYMRLTNKSTACLIRTHVVVPHLAV